MNPLILDDLLWITNRLPKLVRAVLKKHPKQLIIAGGYIRSCVSREEVNDIDLFVPSQEIADLVAAHLTENNIARIHKSENALTIIGHKYTIQIITRWTYAEPQEVIPSFDFTIARATVWWEESGWQSLCDERFYCDLAAKRLVYCNPERNEDAGGSILRVLKFYQRGYSMPLGSLAAVIARLLKGVPDINWDKRAIMDRSSWEKQVGGVLLGLLREVDPQIDPDHISHLPEPTAQTQNE